MTAHVLDLSAPHTVYRNAAGKRLPGVTTVLGVLAKEALIEWAAREERESLFKAWADRTLDATSFGGPYAYSVKRDRAADLGTIVHARIHAFLKGAELAHDGLPDDLYAKSDFAFGRFRLWWQENEFVCLGSECAMVSEQRQTGGTLDVLATTIGKRELILTDIKTSKPHPKFPWDEMIAQVAAYVAMYHENNPQSTISRVCVYRVGKEEGDRGEAHWLSDEQILNGGALFLSALDAYRAKQAIERLR